jgi:prevent-host-death family protein
MKTRGMVEVNIRQARTQLSKLLARVATGEEVLISRAGKPIAKLVPLTRKAAQRKPGRDIGAGFVSDDFDEPLPRAQLVGFVKQKSR